jgi:hypothetical protein
MRAEGSTPKHYGGSRETGQRRQITQEFPYASKAVLDDIFGDEVSAAPSNDFGSRRRFYEPHAEGGTGFRVPR